MKAALLIIFLVFTFPVWGFVALFTLLPLALYNIFIDECR